MHTKSGKLKDAAWSYEAPKPGVNGSPGIWPFTPTA
ncbi:MAG: hypothetical protein R3D84_12465 [Paracoccaceae bacterium]